MTADFSFLNTSFLAAGSFRNVETCTDLLTQHSAMTALLLSYYQVKSGATEYQVMSLLVLKCHSLQKKGSIAFPDW